MSLNCEYATASAGTSVPLLASVDGGGFTVTGQSASCPDAGTVNTWQALALAPFNGLTSSEPGSVVLAGLLGAGDFHRVAGRAGRAGL